MNDYITVIGGGLAGCEAAWQIAEKGIKVKLFEMKPEKFSPAHISPDLAEIVCSNSFKSNSLENAAGLLKEELRRAGSLVISCADETKVPAGQALAVDRGKFSALVTEKIKNHEKIEVIRKEAKKIPEDGIVVIATGPLTSDALSNEIKKITGEEGLYFFDAAAPIVTYESLDMDIVYKADRYGKGESDYLNCPMEKEEYEKFYSELIEAETAELHGFERKNVFEGCMPIEVMAKRGLHTLAFGPLKPVGLVNPATGRQPYAVVQLRQDNSAGTLYNMVGFQTNLKWGEQKRVFQMIPGLAKAEFVRYGVMHRNTYINSPDLLESSYRMKKNNRIFFAGQITGVEGYVESISSGLIAGLNATRIFNGENEIIFTASTIMGALANYISANSANNFQPMNANYGIIPPFSEKIKKELKKQKIMERSLTEVEESLKY